MLSATQGVEKYRATPLPGKIVRRPVVSNRTGGPASALTIQHPGRPLGLVVTMAGPLRLHKAGEILYAVICGLLSGGPARTCAHPESRGLRRRNSAPRRVLK